MWVGGAETDLGLTAAVAPGISEKVATAMAEGERTREHVAFNPPLPTRPSRASPISKLKLK